MSIEDLYSRIADKLDELESEAKDFALWYLLRDKIEQMESERDHIIFDEVYDERDVAKEILLRNIVIRGAKDFLENLHWEVF